jgi:TonB family protein
VIILPLLRKSGEVAGVFEVFSSTPSAFGERDQRALEALSQRVVRNLKRAAEPMPAVVEPSTGVARALAQDITAVYTASSTAGSIATSPSLSPSPSLSSTPSLDAAASGNQDSPDQPVSQPEDEAVPSRGMNILTWVLAAVVLAFAVLLSVLVTERLSGGKATTRAHAAGAVSAPAGNQSVGSRSSVTAAPTSVAGAGSSAAARSTATSPPPGSLLVYENGKEVFRMPPTAEEGEAPVPKDANGGAAPSGDRPGMERAASVEAAGTLKVAPEVAEGSLIHRVEPDYPEEALRQQMQGSVELDVRTGRDGVVREVKLLRGQRLLADAAIAAVKQWRFTPRMVEGQPVEMQTRVTLNFRLPH